MSRKPFILGKKTDYEVELDNQEEMKVQKAVKQAEVARTAENQLSDQKFFVPKKDVIADLEQTDYEKQYQFALKLTNDIILKNYLYRLTENKVYPIDDSKIDLNDIRIFKITEMVYQNQEYSTYKLASVFSSVQNLKCSIAVIIDSDGKKTEFYIGIRADDKKFDAESLKNILKGALSGQFPGVQTKDLSGTEKKYLLNSISSDNIAAVSCVANNKNENFTSNENFIQGLEKLALAMQGKKYTTVILAKSIPPEELQETREDCESTYTQLSFMANRQISYGYNHSENLSSSVQVSESTGSNFAVNIAKQHGESIAESHAVSVPDQNAVRKKGIAGSVASLLGMGVAAAFPTGGVSIAAAGVLGALNTAVAMIPVPTETDSTSHTVNDSITKGITEGINRNDTVSATSSEGKSAGNNEGVQFTVQNKSVLNMMERIDKHLKRIDECESLGMWESAAYFFSDSPVIAEMAAGTYKALIAGENSGVQTTALNLWGESEKEKCPVLHQYITNLIHPAFCYPGLEEPVSAGAMVSSNELAIQMGFPRKSVCGFPVIEHAEFGREVIKKIHDDEGAEDAYTKEEVKKVPVSDDSFTFKVEELKEKAEERAKKRAEKAKKNRSISVGKIYSMGECTNSDVSLSCQRLTEHTFITGSTGAGKSNTTCQILHQFHQITDSGKEAIHFLVIEPAKGEYEKEFPYADVYDVNLSKNTTNLLKLNPFAFPEKIHILHHLDRLVEIFNVCWPMYAAMPAILKKAMHNAYESCNWDMIKSENRHGYRIFPDFSDVLGEIRHVVEESDYSADNKSDYTGSLVTRVESLTTGIFGMVFQSNGVSDADLFDKNVIVDLSSIGSSETKSIIMGILILKLQEYRMSQEIEANSLLQHITVLEEAHHLLKRTSTEQVTESSNLLGKAVEMLTNAIAEMRTYGEGFIIADQSPGLLDMAVIRNTNTKIIHRLPDYSDRELVGRAAGLNDEQIKELSRLEQGIAVVRQSDWLDSVLCKVDKYNDPKKTQHEEIDKFSTSAFETDFPKTMLMDFLVHTDPIDLERLNNEVLFSSLSGSIKSNFLNLTRSCTEDEKLKNWQKLFYNIFHLEKVMKKIKNVKNNYNFIYDMILKQFPEWLLDYNGLEDDGEVVSLKTLVHMMMREHIERDATYNGFYEKINPLLI